MKARATDKARRIRDNVRTLPDAQLSQLITELRFSTRLEQSVLAMALQEKRRRKRREGTPAP